MVGNPRETIRITSWDVVGRMTNCPQDCSYCPEGVRTLALDKTVSLFDRRGEVMSPHLRGLQAIRMGL